MLCVIGYEISKEFIPPSAVLNTAEGCSQFEILKTIGFKMLKKLYFF